MWLLETARCLTARKMYYSLLLTVFWSWWSMGMASQSSTFLGLFLTQCSKTAMIMQFGFVFYSLFTCPVSFNHSALNSAVTDWHFHVFCRSAGSEIDRLKIKQCNELLSVCVCVSLSCMLISSFIYLTSSVIADIYLQFIFHSHSTRGVQGQRRLHFFPWWWAKTVVSFTLSKQRSLRWIDKGNSHLFIQLPAAFWHESERELSNKGQAPLDAWLAWQGCTQWWSFSITAQMCSQRCSWNLRHQCLTAKITCCATLICQINGSPWRVLKWF